MTEPRKAQRETRPRRGMLVHMVDRAQKNDVPVWDVLKRLAWRIEELEVEVAGRSERKGP